MTEWPYPGDSPNARARRVAHAYRATLETYAPLACQQLDNRMRDLGQHWVTPDHITIDPDQWLSPAQAADLMCVETDTIRQMRRRGILTGRKTGHHWQYQTREIEQAFAQPRERNRTVTDTMPTTGTTAPKGAHMNDADRPEDIAHELAIHRGPNTLGDRLLYTELLADAGLPTDDTALDEFETMHATAIEELRQ